MTTSEWDRAVKAAAQDTTITDLIKADRWDEARRIVTERDRRVEQMSTSAMKLKGVDALKPMPRTSQGTTYWCTRSGHGKKCHQPNCQCDCHKK